MSTNVLDGLTGTTRGVPSADPTTSLISALGAPPKSNIVHSELISKILDVVAMLGIIAIAICLFMDQLDTPITRFIGAFVLLVCAMIHAGVVIEKL